MVSSLLSEDKLLITGWYFLHLLDLSLSRKLSVLYSEVDRDALDDPLGPTFLLPS